MPRKELATSVTIREREDRSRPNKKMDMLPLLAARAVPRSQEANAATTCHRSGVSGLLPSGALRPRGGLRPEQLLEHVSEVGFEHVHLGRTDRHWLPEIVEHYGIR